MKVGLIGCGTAAEYCHVPALAALVDPRDVWFVDPALDRARRLAARLGVKDHVASGHASLDLDAAIVAVPNDLHAGIVGDLLGRGVHVLCEKPLARRAAEARSLLERSDPAILAVGNVRRFLPSTRAVRDALRNEICGGPISFLAIEGSVYTWQTASGYSLDRDRAGGGVLLDVGSHVLDQLFLWLGPLVTTDYRDDAHGGIEADCVAELAAGSVRGTVELSRTRRLGSEVRIRCECGTIVAPLATSGPVEVEPEQAEPYVIFADEPGVDGGYAGAFAAQLRTFLAACAGQARVEVDALAAVAVLELIDSCYESRKPLAEPWVTETLEALSR